MSMYSNEHLAMDARIVKLHVAEDGGIGMVFLDPTKNKCVTVVWSNGGGWDHVSASYSSRCPTWEEMCILKDIFFPPDEVAVQYHPAAADYVNIHPFVLHIWRPQNETIPCPPTWMIGPRREQSVADVILEAKHALD